MPFKNKENEYCGYLDWLSSSNFEYKVRRFAIVKHGTPSKLELYFEKLLNGSIEREIDVSIDLSRISMTMKYKGDKATSEHIFYLNSHNGPTYFQAENDQDRDEWCDVISSELLYSGPITPIYSSEDKLMLLRDFPSRKKFNFKETFLSNRTKSVPSSTFYVPTPKSDDKLQNNYFFQSQEPEMNNFYNTQIFKTGMCREKSGYQSTCWQDRFFILNIDGLSFFRSKYDHYLLEFLRYQDMITCRRSKGVLPHLENIFEVVTHKKVFYCQTDKSEDCDDWISLINYNNNHQRRLSLMRQTSSFDDSIINYSC